jgi:hypothetical protein
VIGLVFFLLFLLLSVIAITLFVLRRRGQEPDFLRALTGGGGGADGGDGGFENPAYESTRNVGVKGGAAGESLA